MTDTASTTAGDSEPGEAKDPRKQWHRPNLRKLLAADAEIGINFHNDGSFTAS